MWSFYTSIRDGSLVTRGIQMMSFDTELKEEFQDFFSELSGEERGLDHDSPGRMWKFLAVSETEEPNKARLIDDLVFPDVDTLRNARHLHVLNWERLGYRHVVDCPIDEMHELGYTNFSREIPKINGGQVVLVGQTINNYLTYQLQHKLGTGMVIDGLKALTPEDIWDKCCKQIDWAADVVTYDDFPKNCAFMKEGRSVMGSLDEALNARLDVVLNKITPDDYTFSENDISPIW